MALQVSPEVAKGIRENFDKLTPEDQVLVNWQFEFIDHARPKQLPPEDSDWSIFLCLAGRGWGKSWAGAQWLGQYAASNPETVSTVVAATHNDVRRTCIEGPSGLLAVIPPILLEGGSKETGYNRSNLEITFANGSKIIGLSAEKPDRIRGGNFSAAWCDELAAWQGQTQSGSSNNMREAWDMLMLALRIGENPRCVVTTTPRPLPLIKELVASKGCIVSTGSTYENKDNLAPSFLNQLIKKYEGTRLGRQELEAEILDDMPGALWTQVMVEEARTMELPKEFHRIVVGVDPSGSQEESGSSQGIVTAGLADDGRFYILEDASVKASPKEWAKAVILQYEKWSADLIVAEQNYGGSMVQAVIETAMPNAPVKLVVASRGKQVRAEPIAALYEQGRVKHIAKSAELEQQMVLMTHLGYEGDEKSPDRLDAMIWALTELSTAGDQAEGVILKRAIWKSWSKSSELPEFKHIILSFHLPFDGAENFDGSACSVWGIFRRRAKDNKGIEHQLNNAMLLFAWSGEMTLAEFSDKARATYNKYYDWAGGSITCLIEDVAGASIFARELQRSQIKLRKWAPKRGSSGSNRYEERAHAASVSLERGAVWYREHEKARKCINDVALFPNGTRSEIAKSVIQALLYLWLKLGIELTSDQLDREEQERLQIRRYENRRSQRRRPIYG